jgi:hypothetical protein
MTIAWHFNAGPAVDDKSPDGTAENAGGSVISF